MSRENSLMLSADTDQRYRDAIRLTSAYCDSDEDSALSIEIEMPRLVRRVADFNGDFEALANSALI